MLSSSQDGVRRSGWGSVGWDEPPSTWWGFGIYRIAHPVHDNVVMEPTQTCEISRIVGAASGAGEDVVDLEVVAAPTRISRTAAVAGQDVGPFTG